MARLVGHGGQCCGAGHIYSFGDTDINNVRSLEQCMNNLSTGRMTEIILNDNQCRNNPQLLQRMADFGFVFVGRWINNNHNSFCNAFHRCDRRHRLDDTPWNWPGQTIQANMHGGLTRPPRFPAAPPRPVANPVNRFNGFQRGQQVRIDSPRSRRNGRIMAIRNLTYVYDYYGYGPRPVAEFREANGTRFSISIHNLRPIGPAIPAPQPVAPPVPEIPAFEPVLHVIG